ncbi:uncharacterized protein LOC111188721 [Astyanax mexicanus]|uniref:uncharacterized protein LOC111188721 n=1 Tax=Astyanax mexicanus TaxID=7994 RepID=UPI0020CB3C06|nr:uncharacterized protein LOC111188721 [Astyanax mexicanus]
MLNLTVLLLSFGLLNFSTPMHHNHHRLHFQQSMSSESSDSMESAETDQQVTPTSHAPGSDIIIRAPADFGQPNENGTSAVTVSIRDENTNASVDVLTFIFNTEDDAGRSSAAEESSGFGDEGMQADEPSITQRDITDEQSLDDVFKANINLKDDVPESIDNLNEGGYQTPDSPIGDKSNSTSGKDIANQQTIDFNSDEALQSKVDDLKNDIQADEAFIASLDVAKSIEESTSEGKQASTHPETVYSTDHGLGSNSEETGQIKSQVESHKSNHGTNPLNTHDSGSESQPTHLPEGETMSESLDDPQSQSKELSITLTTVFRYLLGDLIGLRSVPAPLKPQSIGALMTSMEETTSTEAKEKGTDPGLYLSSKDKHKVRTNSGPTISPWVFNEVSPLIYSSEEQEDHDVFLGTDATLSSPVPSPEPLPNPQNAKKDSPKSFSSGPVYVNDGWPAVDYSNSLNDFRHYHKYGYKPEYRNGQWENHEDTDTNTYHETAEHDTAYENTPAYSLEAAEIQSFPTEDPKTQDNLHNKDHPEFTPDFAASREDVISSSSEISKETTRFQIPRATDVPPTDAAPVMSNSLESTETTVGPDNEKDALTVSSSSEELEPLVDSKEQSLATVGSNSQEIQTQTDTPDWLEKGLIHDSGVQQLELPHISVVQLSHHLQKQGKEESSLFVDLTPESSSKEELDQVSSTDAPGLIFSILPPMSSEEQVSSAIISRSTSQPLLRPVDNSESNEEDVNASLNHVRLQPAPLGNFSSENDQNEESFSNESSTDSPAISAESPSQSTLRHESFLLQYITQHPESAFANDLIVSDEDLSSEISTPNPSIGPEITSQTNVAKTRSEESEESQEPSLFTLRPPVAINPSQAPNTKKSSEENVKMDHVANDHLRSNLMPTATSPKEEEANPWATFLQSLKAHMTPWRAEHGEQKVQRPWNKYGNRRHSGQHIRSNKGQKASSSEESK